MAWIKKHFWWEVPKPTDMAAYVGRSVRVTDDRGRERVVEIERIMGNLAHPTKFEIVAKDEHYLISMLDFFGQINGERIDPEQVKLFDETMFEVRQNWRPRRVGKIWTPH